MKAILISNDTDLQKELTITGYFDEINIINELTSSNLAEVVIISDKEVLYNQLLSSYSEKVLFTDRHKVFYMLSDYQDDEIIKNFTYQCKAKNIIIIPPKLTVKQIVDRIIKELFQEDETYQKKVVSFLGSDSKVGTRMISHCCAEILSQKTKAKIGLLNLDGNLSTYYTNSKQSIGLDDLKEKLFNRILTSEELLNTCIKNDTLYILPGANHITNFRQYHPTHIEYLIELANDIFDVTIINVGNNMDSGMAIAAINSSSHKYLVTTQQEASRRKFERIANQIFKPLQINTRDFMVVVNKYIKTNTLYSPSQVADLYNSTLAGYVPHLDFLGWQAEFDKQTLLHYKNDEFNNSIEELCQLIASQLSLTIENHNAIQKPNIFEKLFSKIGG